MGCCFSLENIYWEENLFVYKDWEKSYASIPDLKVRLCLSQYGKIPLDRKLLWLRVAPGLEFPIIITPNTTKSELTQKVIPSILEKYSKERVSFVCLDVDQVPDDLWSGVNDGQYLFFDTVYKKRRDCC
ncbi:hypothetical protein GMAR_ORF67 [Golden Marseillevirus]|uniref:hypothetical protein n=1 Tax=Golden Marseillevirus TaxID=1720526 RepID=UPI000877A9B1|nr:hypothetical protein GMAR_ORF67 [Golden Marseillevirus]ALX27442.1 hypothetical protein GMAR_ORF67 [Golden Marseillevirus]